MVKLYGVSPDHRIVAEELAEIKAKHDDELLHQNQKWWEIFTGRRMAYRIALGVTLQALQQLTGANYFFYYGTVIFKSTGINNSYVTQMILGGVNFGTTFLGLYVVEHFGRRKSLVFGAGWMFVCFMVFASVGHFSLDRDTPQNTPHSGKAMIVFACLFILGFASTWGPIIWTICAERKVPSPIEILFLTLGHSIPVALPIKSYGNVHGFELALEFPFGLFHTFYCRRY
jgi:MFS transporter, SP family, sugar:H+ symporter